MNPMHRETPDGGWGNRRISRRNSLSQFPCDLQRKEVIWFSDLGKGVDKRAPSRARESGYLITMFQPHIDSFQTTICQHNRIIIRLRIKLLNGFSHCHELRLKRLRELVAAQIQLLTGLRQVGKTTVLLA
jgi:hypothetical protein